MEIDANGTRSQKATRISNNRKAPVSMLSGFFLFHCRDSARLAGGARKHAAAAHPRTPHTCPVTPSTARSTLIGE
eukprot:6463666-Prymnesium_polylepis.1